MSVLRCCPISISIQIRRASNLAVATLLVSTPAWAQSTSPSQITPSTFRPAAQQRPADISLPATVELAAPAGADQFFVVIGTLRIEGGFPELDGATREIERSLSGQRVSVAEIYKTASALERAYAEAGFPLVRIAVPPQKLADNGVVRLSVVDGFIEEVDASVLDVRVQRVVERRLAVLIGKRHLTQPELERAVLLAGDVPGLRLKSAMAKGKQAGGTRLVVEGAHRLVTGGSGGDNRLSTALGGIGINANVAVNSALGLGEQFYVSAQTTKDVESYFEKSSPMRMYGFGVVIPLSADGWSMNGEVTSTKTQPRPFTGAPATVAEFERYVLRTSYSVIESRSDQLKLTAEIAHADERTSYRDFRVGMRHDRVDVVRFGADWKHTFADSRSLSTSAVLSQGMGGRTQADAAHERVPLSRMGAEPEFNKLLIEARYGMPLGYGVQLASTVRLQSSFGDPLLLSEQMALDGMEAISAFLPGTLTVDQGVAGRVELIRPMDPIALRVSIAPAPYLFAAAGAGELVRPSALERAHLTAGAIGAGLRAGVSGGDRLPEMSLGLEGGRQLSDSPTIHDAYRVNVNASVKF